MPLALDLTFLIFNKNVSLLRIVPNLCILQRSETLGDDYSYAPLLLWVAMLAAFNL
jgi:hypothetical protein